MILPDIIKNIYMNKKCDWIKDIDEYDIQPYVIQKWLSMNDKLRVQIRWLDKYVYSLPAKMYLSLVWSIIPKVIKMPFTPYIKSIDDSDEFEFITSKIRKHYKMSDNDFNSMRSRILKAIKNDMVNWFSYYGVDKMYWKKYGANYSMIKKIGGVQQCLLV